MSPSLMRAPILVFAFGNPGRGDDGVGPMLAERLEEWLIARDLRGIEVLTDFQLNIEHVLDLEGRRRVLFIDARVGGEGPFHCEAVQGAADYSYTTHAVSPQGLMLVFKRVLGHEPPSSELLSVPGASFELGAELSAPARCRFEAAWVFLQQWCEDALAVGETTPA